MESQKLIEDLMIAANEAAARFFDAQGFPSIYRIHEEPDEEKLGRFLDLARPAWTEQTKTPLPKSVLDDPTSPQALMTLMHGIGEHPSRQALDMLLLRSMKQARYSVDNVGHYGLGSTAYLHFTSPIRRYPDLVVHRLLRGRLSAGHRTTRKKKAQEQESERAAQTNELEDIALSSSERERKAAELERQIQQLHACWLMKERIGEVHEAMVTGCSEAGAFVWLTTLHVEGLVRIDALGREYFDFDADHLRLIGARSREVLGIGSSIVVEVADVDLSRRQISFIRVPEVRLQTKTPSAPSSMRPSANKAPPTPKNTVARVDVADDDDDDDVDTERAPVAWRPAPRPARAWEHPHPRGPRAPVAVSGIRGPDDLRALFDRGPSHPRGSSSATPEKGRHAGPGRSKSKPMKPSKTKPSKVKPPKPSKSKASKPSKTKPSKPSKSKSPRP